MKIIKSVIILILLGICTYLYFNPKIEVEKEPYYIKEYVDLEVKRVNKEIDEQGFEHAVARAVENVVKRYEQLSDSAKLEFDSVNRLLGIARNQLKEWRSYAVTLEDSLLRAEKIDDTFVYSDKWSEIKFTPNEDAGHFSLKYDAKINYAEYWKKSWFLGKKKHYIDFWIEDPRATVNGVKRVKFEPKKPFLGFEIDAVGRVGNDVEVGAEALIRLGHGKIGGGYTYSVERGEWKPVFVGKYNLISY